MSGYFTIVSVPELNLLNLATLMLSSTLLYVSGVIFNDFFDLEIDKKERPFRPLPSGDISKENAKRIAFGMMIFAILLSSFVSWSSFTISLFLSGIILAYDYKLKHNKFSNPIAMGSARFFNVILGASPAAHLPLQTNFLPVIFVASLVLTYVMVIAVLSRKEIRGMQSRQPTKILFSIVYVIITLITIAVLLGFFTIWSLVILVPFAILISLIFKKTLPGDALSIQNGIKNMVISIIILDSVFISGTAGLQFGLATFLFLIPSILLSRRLYVT